MASISKGCSSCWKLLQTHSFYLCGVMAAQNQQYLQNGGKFFLIQGLHSSKTKGVVTPQNGWVTIFWCRLHVYSTLRLVATGAQTYTPRNRLQTCHVWLTLPSQNVQNSTPFHPHTWYWAVLFHSVPRLEQQSSPKVQFRNAWPAILWLPSWPHPLTSSLSLRR